MPKYLGAAKRKNIKKKTQVKCEIETRILNQIDYTFCNVYYRVKADSVNGTTETSLRRQQTLPFLTRTAFVDPPFVRIIIIVLILKRQCHHIYEPVREKTNNLHGRKQRRRSASR